METKRQLTSAEAAAVLHIARSTLHQRVQSGRLRPSDRLPGHTGAYLFDAAEIERIAAHERHEKRRAALTRKKQGAAA
ncbi:helix-turn-helix domain-containing protein [Dermabacteraceae bacterium P13138]